MFVLPFGVGLFIILQLVMLGFKLSMPSAFHFGGNGFVIWMPFHLLFMRVLAFLFVTENRALVEKTNAVKGRHDENQYEMLNVSYLEIEQTSNRLFAMKLGVIYLIFVWESLRESLTKYDISVWSTFGIAIGIVLMFSFEGLVHGSMWWHDERQLTTKKIEEAEEMSEK